MKAVVQDTYGSAEVLDLRDIDRPEPGPDDVIVQVCAAGVNPADWHCMTGKPYLMRLMGFGLRVPRSRVRGLDVAGRVEAVGGNVTRFRPGDEVYGVCDGSFAEYGRGRQDRLAPKPANLTFEQAAAVPTAAFAALQGLRDTGQVQPGQNVLVIGAAGGIGTYAVQLAKAFGAEVTGLCSTTKTELVRSIGADHVIDYTREDFTHFAEGARRYDLILDTAGNRPLSLLRRALTPGGTLVLVGGEGDGRWLQGVDRTLQAIVLSPFTRQKLRGLMSAERAADLDVLRHLIEDGRVTPVIERTYALDEVPQAIRHLERGRARGKIVISL
ncbi:NAD(P)-dependent alcohol dehydrogenase [Streptomyces sp. ALI-76-A]|uniref:NAD(P)-dependent alcohol dehydrogenase n=1 Tax=Streptomyces sp. ALI-76-A TaxID=3025736 RepID=UPI00256F3A5E|nr:NAD(P)-dependent alcohol dehydrogenase [Streptomyces sp. ALI-76-A]MDL5205769.1 NAD(P)-dependent alcohol dehydrogenase [Streptomyces sp. ALI-76-A]